MLWRLSARWDVEGRPVRCVFGRCLVVVGAALSWALLWSCGVDLLSDGAMLGCRVGCATFSEASGQSPKPLSVLSIFSELWRACAMSALWLWVALASLNGSYRSLRDNASEDVA